jgi:dipeptidyl aminopeptidase/acylaminoacyl peptidase
LISFFGSSDIGYSDAEEFLATPWAGGEELVRMSPITYAHKIRTPLLIIHSENDLRCPIEQAEQLFVWLKYLGRRVEFVRFPEEPHGLSRGGRPDRRMARLKFISGWFDRYLK